MRDLIFPALVVGFFAIAVTFVRACELLVGRRAALDETRDQ